MLEAISLLIVLQSYFFCALVQPYRYNHFKDYSIQCLLSITTIHFQGIDFFTFVHPHSSQVSKYESKLYSMPFQRHNWMMDPSFNKFLKIVQTVSYNNGRITVCFLTVRTTCQCDKSSKKLRLHSSFWTKCSPETSVTRFGNFLER